MPDPRDTILLVDDEAAYRTVLRAVLEGAGFAVADAADGPAALEIVRRRVVDLAVLDLMMPRMDGRELMQKLHAKVPELPVVFLTAHGSIPSAVDAIREGAADYLTKPLGHVDDLVRTVRRILDHRRLQRENRVLRGQGAEADPFPAADPATLAILDKARRVAASDATVLITGESGTGKERLARFIHQASPRADRPLVAVNGAAIPENLLESEFFGHEKGAFTGATDRRTGRFEEADRATLFLDEIGEIPPGLQPKLLRALQEREFRRVGGDRLLRFDARLIAATNRDLAAEMRAGRFREDLYYRISVVTLTLPPLRERPRDIRFLAGRFLAELAARFHKEVPTLTTAAWQRLETWPWPGNVRELANCLEATLLLHGEGPVGPADLHGLETPVPGPETGSPLEVAERQAIRDALARCGGNRRQTAERLGMSVRNLLYKLKRLGITPPVRRGS
ncbi:MAG: sigma-54-dependent Fis family transcriptional regulator [Candidatus Riflebacteria bacterium]|nr:sigma-54-dependent Fis family transcriptional regulator [Candidatus Riflebacteria bacterium]